MIGLFIYPLSILSAETDGTIYAVQARLSTPAFQLFLNLQQDSNVVVADLPLYQAEGGVYGMAWLEDELYGIELENGTAEDYLVKIPHTNLPLRTRVSGRPIGFPNIEGLTPLGGKLYGTSLSFGDHRTTLIEIDPITGIGKEIGTGSFDVMIVGLAYDPNAKKLYGASIPFAGLDGNNLFEIDPNTGATTLIGAIGAPIQGLAFDCDLGLIGAFDKLYQIDSLTGTSKALGDTDFTDGKGTGEGLFNGLYGLAAIPPTIDNSQPPVESTSFEITEIRRDSAGTVSLTWNTNAGSVYHIESSSNLSDWQQQGISITAEQATTSTTLSGLPAEVYLRAVVE